MEIFGVIPRPPALFSPFTITTSMPRSFGRSGTDSITARCPGSPIIQKSIFNMRIELQRWSRECTRFFDERTKPLHAGFFKNLPAVQLRYFRNFFLFASNVLA